MFKGLTRRMALAGLAAAPFVQGARAQDLAKASIALLRLTSSGPVFIALEKGWFKEAGLDLAIKDFTAASQPPLAVVSGDADFGTTAFTAGFFNLAAKGGVKVIAAQSAEKPGYPLVAIAVTNAAWDAGVRTIKDLAGKRIAMTTAGSSMHYSIEIVARKHGVDPKTVTMVPLNTLPNMAAAFKGGTVDGALFPVTTWRQVEADGGGHLISWVGDEAPWQLGGVFTAPRTIAERRPLVAKFIAGYQRGAAAYNDAFGKRENGKIVPGPGYDDLLALLATAVKQSPQLVAAGLPYIDPQGRLDVGDIHNQVKLWQAQGQVARDADPKTFVDLTFVNGHFNVPG
ncbi:MAG: ABC transporter substrate-binding protein [Reyranella sp.]|uniref:ABC transporter substrate-binding protein n=1 Tax=Reyranella sp. TaxID=1929291 RepID=UPI001AD52252|nr:ABC transporter substrate-binding protein [Reyranella sp.]MBN9086427.1 ABC transporter substrate-binding protein [Reyranella sp.]